MQQQYLFSNQMFFDRVSRYEHYMLAFPSFNHVQTLQQANVILRLNCGHVRQILDMDIILYLLVYHYSVRSVCIQLRRYKILFKSPSIFPSNPAFFALLLNLYLKLMGFLYQPIFQNTYQVVIFDILLLLRKLSDDMISQFINLRYNIEIKRIDVIVKSIMIQKMNAISHISPFRGG